MIRFDTRHVTDGYDPLPGPAEAPAKEEEMYREVSMTEVKEVLRLWLVRTAREQETHSRRAGDGRVQPSSSVASARSRIDQEGHRFG